MCFENTEIAKYFILFRDYITNKEPSYEDIKKDDNHTVINMQPININNSREISTQTELIHQNEWDIICDNN